MKIYRFSDYYLDIIERRVVKNKNIIELSPKAFDILQFLVERCGAVVAKDEILGKVWGGSFVEEGNLAVHISKIRKLLGADKREPFIETVSGIGYQFVSRVYTVEENEWKKRLSENADSESFGDKPVYDSIAVLPFKNENGDKEIDYLADSFTQNFINSFSNIPDLHVLARNTVFRYKNKDISIWKVGKNFGIATVLTGRIRVMENYLIIEIELTEAKNRRQIWGSQLNQPFGNIFETQNSITQTVFNNLKSHLDKSL